MRPDEATMQDSPTREKAGRPAGACATHVAGEHYRRLVAAARAMEKVEAI